MALAGAEKLIEKIRDDAQRDAEQVWQEAEAKKQGMREAVERRLSAPSRRLSAARKKPSGKTSAA
jgi:vacuolar-type H+-ATPase subunit E/Vma4